jgi:hypothetical protein
LKIGESRAGCCARSRTARWSLDRAGFACTLGGEDGRTLFMLTADCHMEEGFEDDIERLLTGPETGQVLTARAPAAHAGRP